MRNKNTAKKESFFLCFIFFLIIEETGEEIEEIFFEDTKIISTLIVGIFPVFTRKVLFALPKWKTVCVWIRTKVRGIEW